MSTANVRVVITGIGLLTPLGLGIKENWVNILAGKSGAVALNLDGNLTKNLTKADLLSKNSIISLEYKNIPCKIACKINNELLNEKLLKDSLIKKSDLKSMSLANLYAIVAADQAVKDSGWTINDEKESYRAGSSIATGMAGINEVSEAAVALNSKDPKGYKHLSPYFIPRILPNLSGGLINIRYKLKVFHYIFSSKVGFFSYKFIFMNISHLISLGL
jgi:3-oxoacyl-[acyl-carrier-protein] synthase II